MNFFEENFEKIGRIKSTYGDIVGVWLLSDFYTLLADPSALEVSFKGCKCSETCTHFLCIIEMRLHTDLD